MIRYFSAIILVLVLVIPLPASADDATTKARELISGDLAQATYSPVYRAAVEGVSWVRHIFTPAEYLLFGSSDLVLSLAGGSLGGVLQKIGIDSLLGLGKSTLHHPEKEAKRAANKGYQIGLDAYRANYKIYQDFNQSGQISDGTALAFLINWRLQDMMSISKNLYNDVSAYERGQGRFEGSAQAKITRAEQQLDQLVEASQNTRIQKLNLWRNIWKIVAESEAGLPNYPPYKKFSQETRALIMAVNWDISDQSNQTPQPSPPTTVQVYGPWTKHHFKISSRRPWTDTGLELRPGDRIRIRASGRVKYGDPAHKNRTGPEGTNFRRSCSYLCDNAVTHSLVGNIARNDPTHRLDGRGFTVGRKFKGRLPLADITDQAGRLYLGFNDGGVICEHGRRQRINSYGFRGDNSGSFDVDVEIQKRR